VIGIYIARFIIVLTMIKKLQ